MDYSKFLIKPESISVDDIKKDLIEYLESKPDYLKWKGFFTTSAGQIIIDYIVGYAAFMIYHVVVARRETYLHYAENKSSSTAIAQSLGYSSYRGRNTLVRLTFEAVGSPLIFNKWEIIGEVLGYDINVFENVIINVGEIKEVLCLIGNTLEESIDVESSELRPFRFKSPKVSEDVRLYFNGVELPFTNRMKGLTENKHVLMTNALESVDLFYLNNEEPKYNTGDEFRIKFIELANIDFVIGDLKISKGGYLSASVESVEQIPEPVSSIKVNAPLYYETQYSIRGRNDFKKIFKTLHPNLVDTNGRDYSPAIVELTYLKDDHTIFSSLEKEEFLERFTDLPYGTIAPYISDPLRCDLRLVVDLKLVDTNSNPLEDIKEILREYEDILGVEVDHGDIENKITDLDYVKSVRVYDSLMERQVNTFYKKYDFTCEDDDLGKPKFEFFRHLRQSGSVEPLWPSQDRDTVMDGRITWEARDERICNLKDWQADTDYQVGDMIKPHNGPDDLIFVCVKRENLSASVQGSWSEVIGEVIGDGQLIWQVIEIANPYPLWQATTSYEIGDIVSHVDDEEIGYQVVGYRSRSGFGNPVYPTIENVVFEDGDIAWVSRKRDRDRLKLRWNEYINITNELNLA